MRKAPRESALETFVSPRRRDRHGLRQAQNGQGGNPLEVLQEQGEIDPMTYEGKHCEVKVALAIEGVILSGDKANLQVKIHEAMVREKVYEHVRLLDLEW